MAEKVNLIVCEGERILHEGHILEPGAEFEIDSIAAETLVEHGNCELGEDAPKSRKSASRKSAAKADDAPADD